MNAPPAMPEYTCAFRAWVRHVGDLDVAAAATGIGLRKLQRMHAGTARIPPRLLRELAEGADQTGATALGRQLRDAADALDAANPHRENADA